MLTQRAPALVRFTRNDATRLGIAAVILVIVMSAILSVDLLPQGALHVQAGDLAPRDVVAPRTLDYESTVRTDAARLAARNAVPFQYDYGSDKAIAIATDQATAFNDRVQVVDSTFLADVPKADRETLLKSAVTNPPLGDDATDTLLGLDAARWTTVRREAARILQATLTTELRDTDVAQARANLAGRMAGGLDEQERMLAAELISPLVVANSSFSQDLTDQAKAAAAAAVEPVTVSVRQGQVVVRTGDLLTPADIETITALGLGEATTDLASLAGWFLLSVLAVGMLLGLDLALPADALAPRQRARPHRPPARRGHARPEAHRRPGDPPVLRADRGDRDAAGDPARRVRRHDGHGDHRDRRRRRERRLARVRVVHVPRRHGRHRGRAQGRPPAGLRPGGHRGPRRERARRDRLLAARHPRHPGRPRAVVRLGGIGRRLVGGRDRDVRRARLGVRHPHGLPAARAREPVTAAAPPASSSRRPAPTTTR